MGKTALELNQLPEWATEIYGYGDGSGYGDGYGYGSGYGYGDGYGYGYGDGYGDGSGYGSGDSKSNSIYFAAILSPYKRGADRQVMFWRSRPDGTPANGGSGTQARVGLTEEVRGPLQLCSPNALHGTRNPSVWSGERWWVVALHEPVIDSGDKCGSLKRTILADLGTCPL